MSGLLSSVPSGLTKAGRIEVCMQFIVTTAVAFARNKSWQHLVSGTALHSVSTKFVGLG